jgi:hypothetical protein
MGVWRIKVDALAGSRFVISPLSETIASLALLLRNTAAHPGERAWLDTHTPAYRSRLRADPVTALLVRSALRRNRLADLGGGLGRPAPGAAAA